MKMKLALISLIILTAAVVLQAMAGDLFIRGQTLTKDRVAEKWGRLDLNEQSFRDGDEKIKASMAYSILKNEKNYIGKSADEIRSLFGEFSGHYVTEVIPTYIIQRGTNKSEETWQLVFLVDKNRTVSKIVVHKNCCY